MSVYATKTEFQSHHKLDQRCCYWTLLLRQVIFLLLLPTTVYGSVSEQLFVLHSYSQEYPWTRDQHAGFVSSYIANTNQQIIISTEYLDTKRISYNQSYADFFAKYLKQKYINYQPQVVYVTDDNALNFAIEHIDNIFPQAKVIFSGVNDYKVLDSLDKSRVTGVFENKEILPNIELLQLIEPDLKEILVVGDGSNTYQAIEQEIRLQLRRHPGIKASYIANRNIEQITTELTQSKQKYLFLTTIGAITNNSGNQLSLKESISQITAAGDFIIVSMEDAYIFEGVLGGFVTNGKRQGQVAADLALAHQKGKSISQISPVIDSPNSYVFDYRELKREQFELPPHILATANILHSPASFYEENRKLILTSIAVLAALLMLTMAISLHLLARKNRKIKSSSDKLTDQAQTLESTRKSLIEAQRLAKVGSWELDLITNRLTWSDELYRLFEVDKEQFAASYDAFLNAVHPDDRDMVNKAYTNSLVSREPYEIRHRLKMANGSIRYVNETCETSFDDKGKPLLSVGTTQDISELHKAEQDVERLASIVRYSPDFIGIADIEGRALFVNAAGRELVGIRDDEHLYSTMIEDYYPDSDREIIINKIMPAVINQGRWTGEVNFRHFTSGEIIPIWSDVFRIDHPVTGIPINFATISRDLREQKAIEDELINHREHLERLVDERTSEMRVAREEAERANASKSEFLSRMSHELRTPMNAILGFGQILEIKNEGFNEEQKDNIKEILDAGHHLLSLIDEVLDLAKIESGKLQVFIEETHVDTILQQCVSLIKPQLEMGQIELIDHVSGQGYCVQADPGRLKQVMLNLLSNAVKYNSDKGRITLDSEIIDEQRLRISVTDTGQGLTKEEISELFIPFERLNSENNTDGTGIGLVISKRLIEAMDGVIGVESVPGDGCSFWVEIALSNNV